MRLIAETIKIAFLSIWQNKARSFLNILGVIIGVSSVTVLVALGQGLKNDVSNLIQGFGTNVIITIAGKIDANGGSLGGNNPASFITGDVLTLNDVATETEVPDVSVVTPMSLVNGTLKFDTKTTVPTVAGVYPNALEAFAVLKVEQGSMFATKSSGNQIVLGYQSNKDLFGDASGVGQTVKLGTNDFTVVGTLSKGTSSSIIGSQLDAISFIPFDTATTLNKNQVKIYRIIAKASDKADAKHVKTVLHDAVLKNHNDVEDFSVLTQDDLLGLFNTFLNLATTMVTAIAAISLLVGGIGIMNIMLVTVTERTREIGLRKAVGAPKRAILFQFLIEALVVTLVGGLLGLAVAATSVLIVAQKTSLHPQITVDVVGIAVGISMIIGLVFGLWPAIRAANKDPIEALRYE